MTIQWNPALKSSDHRLVQPQNLEEKQYQEHQARQLIKHMPVAVAMLNSEMRYVAVSRYWMELYGLGDRDVIGQCHYEVFPNLSGSQKAMDRRCLVQHEHHSYPGGMTRDHKAHAPQQWQVSPWSDEAETVGGLMIVATATAALPAESNSSESEARFQALAANVPGMLYQFKLSPDGTMTFPYVSDACREIYEIEPEAMGDRGFELLHPDDQQPTIACIMASAQTLQGFKHEWRIITPAGQMKWLQGISKPEQQADGSVLWNGVAFDISDRKKIEAAFQETQNLYQQILDAIPDFILCKGPESRIIYANKAFRDYYGMSLEALQDIIDAPHTKPDYTQQYIQDDAYVFNTGTSLITEEPVVRHDGEERIFSTIKSAIFDFQGQVIQTVGISRDITEPKAIEAQLKQQATDLEQALKELQQAQAQMIQSEKMSSLGQMVAGVAHEINNPVNFIYGNLSHAHDYIRDLLRLLNLYQQCYPDSAPAIEEEAEAIDLEFLIEDLPKLLNSMKVGAERIQKIVSSLRTFSRMDEAEVKAVDLHEGIDSTLMILHNRLKARAERPGIEVIKDYGDLPFVECYPGQINQVFMNILSNAVDALEEALKTKPTLKPCITIRTALTSMNHVVIRIADNGLGIPHEIQQRLFEPFFTTKEVGKGTGIGLAISDQIVTEKHQGTLLYASEPNRGTEFAIHIPLRQT